MNVKDLIDSLYGTSHGGIQNFSRINGKDYVWNYAVVKDGKYQAVLKKDNPTHIILTSPKTKVLPMDGTKAATNEVIYMTQASTTDPKFLERLYEALKELGNTLCYVDHKLGCVGIDIRRGMTIQLFQSGKPDSIEIWKYSPPNYNNGEVYLKGPKVVPLRGAAKALLKFGVKLPNLKNFQGK